MFKYKRGINNFDDTRQLEYSISDNGRTCLCTSGSLECRKPYHGIYIRNGKVMVENVFETFEIGKTTYKVAQFQKESKKFTVDEFVDEIDLEAGSFEYTFGPINMKKKIAFQDKTGILCIEYIVKNNDRTNANMKVVPLITYRDFMNMKNNTMLKFNQRSIDNGTLVSLSVLNQENIVFKSDKMKWKIDTKILNDVRHELITKDLKKEIYVEDLMICGNFEFEVKGFSEEKIRIYLASKDFNLNKMIPSEIFYNADEKNKEAMFAINENFFELIELSKSISHLNLKDIFVSELPYRKGYNKSYKVEGERDLEKDIDELIEIVRSVDGQYLSFKKISEAKSVLSTIYEIIKEIGNSDIPEKLEERYNILRLWYVESANRILQKESKIELYIDSIKEIIYSLINTDAKSKFFRSVETVALMINAIKIYINLLGYTGESDAAMKEEENYFVSFLENNFWLKERQIMKRNLNDVEHSACIEMIYTLSLSYPCVGGEIPNKILDTIFKELYTPYGLREISKISSKYNGMIYPMYMAHFIKANLRLSGVTRASQKIAYNLVRELLQDIGKYVNGGMKKIYNEKGIAINITSFDLLTNAEMIRMYYMLT